MSAGQEGIRERGRLLAHLGEAGAFAMISPLGCGRLALFRQKGHTSLGAGYVSAATVEAVIDEGLARWLGEGRGARLVGATPEPSQRAEPKEAGGGGKAGTARLDERESPLLWLHRRAGKDGRPQISDAQFAAGERFRADLTLAQMLPRTTMNWDASLTPGNGSAGPRDPAAASDSAVAARQRVRSACERLGPELSGLAIDVCGFLKELDQVERERRWPARSAKIVLRLALSGLASHYGLDQREHRPAPHAPWLAPDARPSIMPPAV